MAPAEHRQGAQDLDRLVREAAAVVAATDADAASDVIGWLDNGELGLALSGLRKVTLDYNPGIHPAADLVQQAISLSRGLDTQGRRRRR
jgi:hypothetical protein